MKKFLLEVSGKVEELSGRRLPAKNLHAPTERLGIRIPLLRSAVKTGYSFYAKTALEILAVWDYVWRNSRCYEVMTQALYYYQNRTTLTKAELETVSL
ncbi:MAG: hypothetical protein E2O59_09690, partial [Gammaproteobacteria bacterium]